MRAVMFSSSPCITSFCELHNITTIASYRKNGFNMPILKHLILDAQSLFSSRYYAYINSDVLLSPLVFDVLRMTVDLVANSKLSAVVVFRLPLHCSTASQDACTTSWSRTSGCRWTRWRLFDSPLTTLPHPGASATPAAL